MFALQYTPEPSQKTVWAPPQSSASDMDPNMTFEVLDNAEETASNATIIIRIGSPCRASTDVSDPGQPLHLPEASEGNRVPTKK